MLINILLTLNLPFLDNAILDHYVKVFHLVFNSCGTIFIFFFTNEETEEKYFKYFSIQKIPSRTKIVTDLVTILN